MTETFETGEEVVIPWGLDEVRGRIAEIYGQAPRVQVVIELTPELSSYVVDAPTTVTMPLDAIKKTGLAA